MNKRLFTVLLIGALLVSVFVVVASPVFAQVTAASTNTSSSNAAQIPSKLCDNIACKALLSILSVFVSVFVSLVSLLLNGAISLLIYFASYNGFGSSPAVTFGWVIVRDLANMFFIVVLLIIAISTILEIEKYQWKQMLPRLLLMAVLINFSRTISLLVIDVSQVVMLTFVSTFEGAASNFTNAFGMSSALEFVAKTATNGVPANIDAVQLFFSYVFALILMVIALSVIAAMTILLIGRIIMLWLLIVLSPMAYFLSTFPKGQEYHQQWWKEFTNHVIVGPVLAFFIWLSLQVMATIQGGNIGSGEPPEISITQIGVTQAGTRDNIVQFVIAAGMFLGGLQMAQKLGVMGGQLAASVAGSIQAGAKGIGAWGLARADDAQAALQKRLATSKYGEKIATSGVGKYFGLDKLRTHGVALRTLPEAWKARSHRMEEERLGESKAVATDIMNRAIPIGRVQSDDTVIARKARIQKVKKEKFENMERPEEILHMMESELVDKNGKAVKGREHELEAALEVLTKNHDLNELAKSKHFSQVYGTNREYNADTVVKMLDQMFESEDDKGRVGNSLGMIGLENKDGALYGLGEKDVKKGEYKLNRDAEARAGASAAYLAKRSGRAAANLAARQDVFTESVVEYDNVEGKIDPETKKPKQEEQLVFRKLHEGGKMGLKRNAGSIAANYGYTSEEYRIAMAENLDVIYDWFNQDKESMKQSERTGIEQFMGQVVARATKRKDPDRITDTDIENYLRDLRVQNSQSDLTPAINSGIQQRNAATPNQPPIVEMKGISFEDARTIAEREASTSPAPQQGGIIPVVGGVAQSAAPGTTPRDINRRAQEIYEQHTFGPGHASAIAQGASAAVPETNRAAFPAVVENARQGMINETMNANALRVALQSAGLTDTTQLTNVLGQLAQALGNFKAGSANFGLVQAAVPSLSALQFAHTLEPVLRRAFASGIRANFTASRAKSSNEARQHINVTVRQELEAERTAGRSTLDDATITAIGAAVGKSLIHNERVFE